MKLETAKEINDKLKDLVSKYPELSLNYQLTFCEDYFEKGKIYTYITLQNSSTSAMQQEEFCKQHNIPYASYENGEFVDSSINSITFED